MVTTDVVPGVHNINYGKTKLIVNEDFVLAATRNPDLKTEYDVQSDVCLFF